MNKTIHELNSLTQAQADDELIIYDVSEGESKKIQVQALNNPNYSTTEQKTGGTWIDGKPIYRRVYDGLNFGGTANNWVNTGATTTGVDRLINATVMRYDSVNDMNAVISLINIRVQISTGNIQYYTTTTSSMCDKIIIEYTKTTD